MAVLTCCGRVIWGCRSGVVVESVVDVCAVVSGGGDVWSRGKD